MGLWLDQQDASATVRKCTAPTVATLLPTPTRKNTIESCQCETDYEMRTKRQGQLSMLTRKCKYKL